MWSQDCEEAWEPDSRWEIETRWPWHTCHQCGARVNLDSVGGEVEPEAMDALAPRTATMSDGRAFFFCSEACEDFFREEE